MSKKALLGGLLPLLTNPGTMMIAGAGIIGITVYGILTDEDKNKNCPETVVDGSELALEPFEHEDLVVDTTDIEPSRTVDWMEEETVHSPVVKPSNLNIPDDSNRKSDLDETNDEEDQKKELIRLAMSELGKRSAAARAKKKITP
jgi:hypothetical protein